MGADRLVLIRAVQLSVWSPHPDFLVPLGLDFWMSLNQWPLLGEHTFVGLQNYAQAVRDSGFLDSILTLLYTAIITPILLLLAFVLALLVQGDGPRVGALPHAVLPARAGRPAARGSVAVERGPIVYCFEQVDQPEGVSVLDAELDVAGPFDAVWRPELLDGVVQVEASGTVPAPGSSDRLYAPLGTWRDARRSAARLHAIPYDAWANRGPAAMRVWIPAAQRR